MAGFWNGYGGGNVTPSKSPTVAPPSSGGGFWGGYKPSTTPAPPTPQDQATIRSFQSLDPTTRSDTINRLTGMAHAGDAGAAHRLSLVAAIANKNVPKEPNYGSANPFTRFVQGVGSDAVEGTVGLVGGGTAGETNLTRVPLKGGGTKVTAVDAGSETPLNTVAANAILARVGGGKLIPERGLPATFTQALAKMGRGDTTEAAGAALGKTPVKVTSTPHDVVPAKSLTSYEGAPDRAQVEKYKAQIQAGKPIEPLKVSPDSKGNLGIEDGKHRFQAMQELGIKDVPVEKAATSQEYVKGLVSAQKQAAKGPGKLDNALQEFRTKLIDSNAPIEDVLHAAKRDGAKIAPENDITPQIDRVLRAPSLAGQFVHDNGLVDVIKKAPNIDELNQYLIAKHGADLANNGVETGRNAALDAKLVNDLGPTYEPHAQAVKQYSNNLLDYITSKGLISPETAAALKTKYPNYVPFNRIFKDGELATPQGVGGGKTSLSTQSVIQSIKGSGRQVENPIESLLSKTQDAFKQGERNDAARMLTSYKDLPGNPFDLRELGPNEPVGSKNTVSFLDNGTKRTFETTPEIASAAKNLNPAQLGLIGKIFSVPTRVLRLGATGLNLPFVAANVAKDQVTGLINSDKALATSIANPRNFLTALFNAVGHGKEYENAVRSGAMGTSFDIGRDAVKQTVGEIRAARSAGSQIAYTVTHPAQLLRAMEDIIGRSEELTRIQQFTGTRDALVSQGHTPAEAEIMAAHAARNNTTNFARAGEWGRVLNSVLPFFNAGIQGSRTLMRNLTQRPAQTAGKIAVTTFFPMAAVTAWNLSDPQRRFAYDNIKDYEKQGNLIIVPPNPTQNDKGQWNVIKIPLSQEIANLASGVRNGVEAMAKDKGFDLTALAGDLIGTGSSLNTGSGRQLLGQLTPQAIKPAIEGITNQNLFTGNQIVPDSLKSLPTEYQQYPDTSATATALGHALHVSPLQVANAVSTAGGGVGRQLLNASDQLAVALHLAKPSQVGGQSVSQGITSRFATALGTAPGAKTSAPASAPVVNGKTLNAQEFSNYQALAAKIQKSKVDAAKNDSSFKNLSSADKTKTLTQINNAAHKEAAKQLFGNAPKRSKSTLKKY